MNNLEYIIEDIYNEEEKKGFLNFLNPKNWSMFSNLLKGFSSLIQYKDIIKNILTDKSQELQKLVNLFASLKDNSSNLSDTVSQLMKNEAQKSGLKITDPKKLVRDALESPNPIGNTLSLINAILKQKEKIEESDLSINNIKYFSEFLFEEAIKIQNLEVINEVVKKKSSPKIEKKIITRKEASKSAEYIQNWDKQSFGGSDIKRFSGKKRFFIFVILIGVALVKAFSFGSGLEAAEKVEAKEAIKDYTFKIISADDTEQIKGLQDDIKAGEDTLKNIQDLKAKAAAMEKKISEKEGSFKGKFGFTDTAKEVKQMKADLKALKVSADTFGDSEKIKNDIDNKKAELEKFNKSLETKEGIFKYLTGNDFGKTISDQEVKDGIKKQLNEQSIKFLDQGNETVKGATEAKTGLFNKTLADLESKKPELQKATPETKADVVNKYLEDVQKGKVIDKDTKTALDDIKKLEVKADLLKKAGFAIADKKITTKDLDIFAKKSLAEQVSKILNPTNSVEYEIEYTYDAKTGEVKIDTTTNDYKALQQDIKILQNDPLFKSFKQEFKETMSKISGDINKLTKSLEKLQDLKDQKETLKEKLDKATDKDKPSIQEKIDKLDSESQKISGNQDTESVNIGLGALQDFADSKNISVEEAIKMYKSFELNDQIEMKIMIANSAAEMKALGFTDSNEFKDYKSLNVDKTNNWSADDNKTFVESMKYNGLKFSDIKKAMSDPEVKKVMNGKLWDIKDSSGKWKISNESAKEFKKLVEAKAPQKTSEAKTETKTDTKVEVKKDAKKADAKTQNEINKAAELKDSVKSSYKNLNTEQKNILKQQLNDLKTAETKLDQAKQEKQGISSSDATDINKIDQKIKAFEKTINDNKDSILKTFKGTGLDSKNLSTVISDSNYVFNESKNDVSHLFTILEQNYFKK